MNGDAIEALHFDVDLNFNHFPFKTPKEGRGLRLRPTKMVKAHILAALKSKHWQTFNMDIYFNKYIRCAHEKYQLSLWFRCDGGGTGGASICGKMEIGKKIA